MKRILAILLGAVVSLSAVVSAHEGEDDMKGMKVMGNTHPSPLETPQATHQTHHMPGATQKAGTGAPEGIAPPSPTDPDPMAMMETMEPTDRWMTMLHGYAFLNLNRQGGPAGDRNFESQNHLMAMAVRKWGGGKLSLLGTFTLEPATIPDRGSSQLFQRGETFNDVLLIDRQHQHDLFVQLAVAWEKSLNDTFKLRVYVAPRGEPALGPVAYPHRPSASENPTATLSHHNQDSTHIANDVATLSLTASIFTIEGSVFSGREPDENRWDVEQRNPDSFSGRIWARPTRDLALQVSVGKLKHPEAIEDGDQTRTTASISYQRGFDDGYLAVTAILGHNQTADGAEWGNTLEGTWKFARSNFVYARLEDVDRDLYELVNKRQRPQGVPHEKTRVQAGTLGYVRNVPLIKEAETGLGADLTLHSFDSRLDSIYSGHPVSAHFFFRVRFSSGVGMDHGMSHGGMKM